MTTKRILLINGHPREGSLCDALADAYEQGLKRAGHIYKRTNLRDLTFELNLNNTNIRKELEPDLKQAQKDFLIVRFFRDGRINTERGHLSLFPFHFLRGVALAYSIHKADPPGSPASSF